MMPKISVVICSYNRCEDVKALLECLLIQKISENNCPYEVIVVDNNSIDNTKGTVESYMPQFAGRLCYLFDPRQGKSFALNLGIEKAKGEILVFTDDDCLVEENYLAQIYKTFKEYGAQVGFIGGKLVPQWVGCARPQWFADLKPGWWSKEFFWGPLAILDYGEEPFMIDWSPNKADGLKLFYGGNLAVRKELILKHGNIDLEKINTHDTELQLRFLRGGAKGLYAPKIRVYHKITAKQLTPQYYYHWYFVRGKLLEVQERYQKKFYHPFGIQWVLIVQTLKLWMGSIFVRSLADKIYRRSHVLFNLGQMIQIARKNIV